MQIDGPRVTLHSAADMARWCEARAQVLDRLAVALEGDVDQGLPGRALTATETLELVDTTRELLRRVGQQQTLLAAVVPVWVEVLKLGVRLRAWARWWRW